MNRAAPSFKPLTLGESRYKSYLSILDDRMESKYREEF